MTTQPASPSQRADPALAADATDLGGPAQVGQPGPAAGSEPIDVPWRRLSIRMLAVHPVVELGRALPAVVALLVVGSQQGQGGWWSLAGLVFAVAFGLLRWTTTRYRITPVQVQVKRGLLNRRVLTVPRDRVRSVDVTAHVMHRLLGLARVAVGTGQSDRQKQDGLVLDGLSALDAQRLRDELLHSGRSIPTQPGAAVIGEFDPPQASGPSVRMGPPLRETTIAALSPAWIRYGPFTLSGLVTIGVLLAFGQRTVSEAKLDPGRLGPVHDLTTQLASLPVTAAVAEVGLLVVLLMAIASTVAYVLAFWNFRLARSSGGTLHVSRGLLTTRSTTIEERRLRGVELSEPLLLRAVGGGRCIAITTGLRVGRGAERGGSLLLPPAPTAEAVRVAGVVLGDTEAVTVPLIRHPRAARRRRIGRMVLAYVVVVGPAGLVTWQRGEPTWFVVAAGVGAVLALGLALDRYRSLGHAVVDGRIVFRQGSIVRRRSMLANDGVIGVTIRQSIFQRWSGLVTVTATTAAGRQRYALPDVSGDEAVSIADRVLPGVMAPFLVRSDGA